MLTLLCTHRCVEGSGCGPCLCRPHAQCVAAGNFQLRLCPLQRGTLSLPLPPLLVGCVGEKVAKEGVLLVAYDNLLEQSVCGCVCVAPTSPPPRKHLEPRPLIAFHPFPLLPPNYLRLFAVAAVPFRGCRFHRHLSMPTPARLPSPQAWACRYPVRWPRQGVAGWVWSAQMCRHRRSHSPLPTSWRQEAVRAVACVMRWGICCSVN